MSSMTAYNPADVERLARDIHEAGREPVRLGLVVVKANIPFASFDEISEEAREGRRLMARFLLDRHDITPKT